MRESVARIVEPFLTETDAVAGQAYSAVLYGSAARGDFVPGRSNINLMLVLDELNPATLRSLSRAFTGWRKKTPEPPLVLSRAEWDRASVVAARKMAGTRHFPGGYARVGTNREAFYG